MGLLGKIGQGAKGLLNNPFVQGVAGVAAVGANPLLGLLAGGFIKNDRERRQLENDVTRAELRGLNRRDSAQDDLKSLLQDRTTEQSSARVGGLLDINGGGPSEFRIPGRRELVPTIGTPEGKRQALGLLGDLAPNVAAQGLLGQIFPAPRTNSAEQKLSTFEAAIGRRATESEIANMMGAASPDAAISTQLLQLQIAETMQRINNTSDEADRKRIEADVENKAVESSVLGSLNNLVEMGNLNNQLDESGILTKPGFASEGRRNLAGLASMVGGALDIEGSDDLEQSATDAQRFDQLADSLAIMRLEFESFNAGTDSRFDAWRKTKPRHDIGTPTNALVIADTIDATLDVADARHIEVPDRKMFEGFSRQLREQYKSPPPPPGFK
ncbi:MAG: hypothetical protein ACPGSI_18765 [Pikeienuella sp.]